MIFILRWLFYDFTYESWPMRIASILLATYFFFILFVLGWGALELLTYLAHL